MSGNITASVHHRRWPHMLVMLTLTSLVCTCSNPGPAATSRAEALHAVMTQDIQRHAARINALFLDQHRTETELAALRQDNAIAISNAARSLRAAASQLEQLTPVTLPASDRPRFRALAAEVELSASDIVALANQQDLAPLSAAINRLNQTCHSCHQLYRTP